MVPPVHHDSYRVVQEPGGESFLMRRFRGGVLPTSMWISSSVLPEGIDHRGAFARDLDQLGRAVTQEIPSWNWRPKIYDIGPTAFRAQGRSLYRLLEEPFENAGKGYNVLRAKGVTDHGRPPEVAAYGGVSDDGMVNSRLTLVVAEGRTYLRQAPRRPKGFMLLDDAKHAFEVARYLGAQNVPTVRLIGFGEFEGKSFDGRPLGWNLSLHYSGGYFGGNAPGDLRLEGYVSSASASRFTDLLTHAFESLRRMHDAGCTHGQPHLGNFAIDEHSGQGLISDLDQVRLHRRQGDAEDVFKLFVARDLLGMMTSARSTVKRLTLGSKSVDDLLDDAFQRGYLRGRHEQASFRGPHKLAMSQRSLDALMDQQLNFVGLHGVSLKQVLRVIRQNAWLNLALRVQRYDLAADQSHMVMPKG